MFTITSFMLHAYNSTSILHIGLQANDDHKQSTSCKEIHGKVLVPSYGAATQLLHQEEILDG